MDNTTEYNDIMAELKPKCKVKASQHLHDEISRMCDLQPKRNRGKIITFLGAVSSVAAILIAVFFTPTVSAKELLDDAIKNLGTVRTMVMELDVRTHINENFDHIELDAEFIPHTIQVKYEADGKTWRVDKGGRISCGDNQLQYLWITSTHLGWKKQSSHESFIGFINMFLEPQKILEAEYYLTKKQHNNNYKVEKKGNELVLTVHAQPQGDYTNPYMLNFTLGDSENIRCYTFDADTRALKDISISVLYNGSEIEMLKTRNIVYNTPLDNAELMKLSPEVTLSFIKCGGGVACNTAEEAAHKILSAFRDWDTDVLDLCSSREVMDVYKETYKGSQLISTGISFRSGTSEATFVPYTLKLPSGKIKEFNLALRQYSDSTWTFSGGL